MGQGCGEGCLPTLWPWPCQLFFSGLLLGFEAAVEAAVWHPLLATLARRTTWAQAVAKLRVQVRGRLMDGAFEV